MDHILHHHPEYVRALWSVLIAIALSAVGAIVATVRGWRRGVYVLKPLTTLLILMLAMHLPASVPVYRQLIMAGLVFSLIGDVFLMLPRDHFVAGLVSFLVAHLLYIGAFTAGWTAWPLTAWVLAPFVIHASVLMWILLPHVPRALKAAVVVYAAALLVMAWQAAERGAAGVPGGVLAAAGGVLFVISDSALALDRFRRPFPGAQALVLATYWAAQTLIALSIT
ncbi:MAG TPA: lysoplasmalogenase [Longimicrobium sp.]|nr:lysoplasmalogenase [Longimicrobium sp.]